MTVTTNAAQAEYWSGPSGTSWITHEDEMDALLSPVTRILQDSAGDVAGQEVLDIGCGTGAVSLAFADAGARVLASDISQPLLERTAARGPGRIDTLLADAQSAVWPRPFDLAVSRFGVMFFADPAQAFTNIARALKPGGRALFAAWGPFNENPWWHMPQTMAARQMGVTEETPDPHVPGPMGLSDKDWTLARMRDSALSQATCEAVDVTLNHRVGAAAAGTLAAHVGPAARVLNMHGASETDRTLVAQSIAEALSENEVEGIARIPARIYLYSATRA